MPSLRFKGPRRECFVPIADVAQLVRELRLLPSDGYPDAVAAAVILESAVGETTALREVDFNKGESPAFRRALEGMLLEGGASNFSEGLFCLRDAFLIDAGLI